MNADDRLAQRIVDETMKRMGENINIIDASGKVIASGNHIRVGQLHPAALKAIRNNEMVMVHQSDLSTESNMQAGINIPLSDEAEVIGAIGITGDPIDTSHSHKLSRWPLSS